VLVKHVDQTFNDELEMLLKDEDLRKRGLALYIAVRLRGEEISLRPPFDHSKANVSERVFKFFTNRTDCQSS